MLNRRTGYVVAIDEDGGTVGDNVALGDKFVEVIIAELPKPRAYPDGSITFEDQSPLSPFGLDGGQSFYERERDDLLRRAAEYEVARRLAAERDAELEEQNEQREKAAKALRKAGYSVGADDDLVQRLLDAGVVFP